MLDANMDKSQMVVTRAYDNTKRQLLPITSCSKRDIAI